MAEVHRPSFEFGWRGAHITPKRNKHFTKPMWSGLWQFRSFECAFHHLTHFGRITEGCPRQSNHGKCAIGNSHLSFLKERISRTEQMPSAKYSNPVRKRLATHRVDGKKRRVEGLRRLCVNVAGILMNGTINQIDMPETKGSQGAITCSRQH